MLSHCPNCETPLGDNPGGGLVGLSPLKTYSCPACNTRWRVAYVDPAQHVWREIDDFYKGESAGVFTQVLYPVDMKICQKCGLVFSGHYTCCPELLELAMHLLSLPAKEQGPSTARLAGEFLARHRKTLLDRARDIVREGSQEQCRRLLASGMLEELGLELVEGACSHSLLEAAIGILACPSEKQASDAPGFVREFLSRNRGALLAHVKEIVRHGSKRQNQALAASGLLKELRADLGL